MAADLDFSKKYMLGLALLLKKGLHLNIIHSLNRPFQEMMLGLRKPHPALYDRADLLLTIFRAHRTLFFATF